MQPSPRPRAPSPGTRCPGTSSPGSPRPRSPSPRPQRHRTRRSGLAAGAALAATVLAALALPAVASAHATLVRTIPADGAVLARAPRTVVVEFDDTVRSDGKSTVVANTTGNTVTAGTARAHGRTLTIPLRAQLADGDYSVRWSIVSDDGHHEVGVFAFSAGTGTPPGAPILSASAPLGPSGIVLRVLWDLGLLVAGGASLLGLLLRDLQPAALRRPLAHLLFFALLCAFVGAGGLAHGTPEGTRFADVLDVALVGLLVAATAAALAPRSAPLLRVAQWASLLLLISPPLAGHALDPGQPAVLAPLADLAHIAAASAWLGGLAWLLAVAPHADVPGRRRATRRFSTVALVAVAVLGASGIGRAVTELSAVHQLWTTSYGRALLVKTGLFLPLLLVGFVNRTRLLDTFAALRRSLRVEVVVIAGIVVAVAFLTQLRPGADEPAAAPAAPLLGLPPVLPPRDAVVDAKEVGLLAVAIARTPGRATLTIVDQDANGAAGLDVRIDGRPAAPCGSGCYRAPAASGPVAVEIDGRRTSFDVSPTAPAATKLVVRLTRDYRARRTVVFTERLASSPTNAQVTRFELEAPHSLSYATVGGPQAIVIGARRWDRASATARWQPSPESPLAVPSPYWTTTTNAHLVGPRTVTFLDRAIPAWFRVTLEPGRDLPRRVGMTAAAHFMVDGYSRFDGPVAISPPPSR
jgi:copper transport protein